MQTYILRADRTIAQWRIVPGVKAAKVSNERMK
jgi:hypothetical protein